jgi:acetyl-CoA decarbonylase/synthase complex subunit gamma
VLAQDITTFLANGWKKTEPMRTISFGLYERAVLAPVEIVHAFKWFVAFVLPITVFAMPLDNAYSSRFLGMALLATTSFFAGTVAFPLLLPFLPFRAFALKGLTLGLTAILSAGFLAVATLGTPVLLLIAVGMPGIALVVWLAMNFTGCTTFTSQTGAALELKLAWMPLLAVAGAGLVLAVVLLLANLFA